MILLCWYKRYSIFLISFFNLYELFPTFICANNIGSLVNNLCGIGFLILFLLFFFFDVLILFFQQLFLLALILLFQHLLVVNDLQQNQELIFQVYLHKFILFFLSSESLSYWVIYMVKRLSYNLEAVLITTFLFSKSFSWYFLYGLMSSIS